MAKPLFKQAELLALVADYNDGQDATDTVNADDVVKKLRKAGAAVEAAARQMSFEEIEAAGLPKTLARVVASLWRAEEKPVALVTTQSETHRPTSEDAMMALATSLRLASQMSDAELLAIYKPNERDDVIQELDKRARGKRFIVFADKTSLTINRPTSEKHLELIKQGVEIGETTMIDGVLCEMHRAGELPIASLDICPVHECHLVDGFCPQCNFNWKGVPQDLLETVWIYINQVLADKPKSGSPELNMLLSAVKNAGDQFWNEAKMKLVTWKDGGQVIVLRKPIRDLPGAQAKK